MVKLSDPNPYEILGLEPEADKSAITKAFAHRDHGTNQDRREARIAYDTLRNIEERILVDVFQPPCYPNETEISINDNEFGNLTETNWSSYLDIELIFREDLLSLRDVLIQKIYSEIPSPQNKPILSEEYNLLDEYIDNWLK